MSAIYASASCGNGGVCPRFTIVEGVKEFQSSTSIDDSAVTAAAEKAAAEQAAAEQAAAEKAAAEKAAAEKAAAEEATVADAAAEDAAAAENAENAAALATAKEAAEKAAAEKAAAARTARLAAAEIYKTRCTACHGARGYGDGVVAAAINPKPANFSDPAWQKAISNKQIELAILKGGAAVGKSPLMPANPDLAGKPAVIRELRRKVRSCKK